MKLYYIFMCSLILFLFSCSQVKDGSVNQSYGTPSTPLILISIDGFRWDYFDKVETPNLDKIINGGVKAEGLKTSYPSKTFPNHISIVTVSYTHLRAHET